MSELYIKGIQGQWEVTFWVYKAHVRSLNGSSPRVLAFDIKMAVISPFGSFPT